MTPDPTRRTELAAIHVAAKALALAEDSYRGLIARFAGGRTESAGELTIAERRQLLDHFRALGFKPKPKTRKPGQPRPDLRPQAAKLRALWRSLWQLGVVSEPGDKALSSFVARHTGIDLMQWTNAEQLRLAIECLRSWCARVGYEARPFKAEVPTPQQGSFAPALIAAQWARLGELGALRHGASARLDTWLLRMGYQVQAPQFLTREQADEVIATLGNWLRRTPKPEGGDDGGS